MAVQPPTLDQIVKGAPAPHTSLNAVAAAAAHGSPPPYSANLADAPDDAPTRIPALSYPRHAAIPDPTALLPSAPPQIYLNLLILEASLRSQYLTLRARRRQNMFVLTLLFFYLVFFFDLIFLRPREDGKGRGGSRYWLVDMSQKVCFITGVVTALLFWATGQWDRGVKWPRRWVGVANRGLRGVNAKMVVIRGPWYRELFEWLLFLRPFSGGLWGGEQGGSSYHFINVSQEKSHGLHGGAGSPRHRIVQDGKEYAEEDIAPGGDYIKLLLLPKPFTPDFRQNWETYRAEYWEKENERRFELRKSVRARRRAMAREQGGWLWWTGWRGWKRARGLAGKSSHAEKSGGQVRNQSLSHNGSRRRRPSVLQPAHHRGRDLSHSRSSSRSMTPTPDLDDRLRPNEDVQRRWSNSTTGSTASTSRPNSLRSAKLAQSGAQTARRPQLPAWNSKPSTTESIQSQSKRTSMLTNPGSMTEGDDEGYEVDPLTPPKKRVSSRESSTGRAESA
ncbi:Nem1-Spo7 phosphatase regulatory subunit [Pleosporales sp. CAS-2024a]